jgi:sterol desaturase/sphingolipid hydroxylase (fatty acid hydroxylase superfamily)
MGWAAEHNPHSMKSDWHQKDRSTWNFHQRFIDYLNVNPIIPNTPLPKYPKTEKMPYMSQLSQHLFIVVSACIPIILHQAWVTLTGHSLGKWGAFFLYNAAYTVVAIREVRLLRRLTYKYGCLDGDVADRDGIPNTAVGKMIASLHKTTGFRLALAVLITYNPTVSPLAAISDLSSWAPFITKLSLYGVILDFWFYTYHRACHEVPSLWKYHRTHHLTKHPTAVFSAFADDEQELIEMILVPFLTFATLWLVGLPLGFYEWWICLEYVTFAEVLGHSGIRVHTTVPSPITWLLQLCDAELAVEDHDLHHRRGWKKSFNYGKQTRVWDRLFGSCLDRLEAKPDNIDYGTVVWMPIF